MLLRISKAIPKMGNDTSKETLIFDDDFIPRRKRFSFSRNSRGLYSIIREKKFKWFIVLILGDRVKDKHFDISEKGKEV